MTRFFALFAVVLCVIGLGIGMSMGCTSDELSMPVLSVHESAEAGFRPIKLSDNPYAIPIGPAGGGVGGSYPGNLVLLLGDAACLDGQLPNGFQQPQTVANDLIGATGDAAVIAAHGSGTSFITAGTQLPVYSNTSVWVPVGGDGGVWSWQNETPVTTISTYTTCGQWTPPEDTSLVWTCYVMCQDVTGVSGGGHINGHNFSGSLQFNVTQSGTSAPVLNPSTPTFSSIGSNTLTGSAQAVVVASTSIAVQAEYTSSATTVDCQCACSGIGGR